MPKESQATKWKPTELHLRYVWIGYGTLQYTCFASNVDFPVGIIYGRPATNHFSHEVFEVLDIYVPAQFRRMGVARFMLQTLLNTHGIVSTVTGTKDGLPLLKAMQFKLDKQAGIWLLKGKIKSIAK
jgi:hypothetical protein